MTMMLQSKPFFAVVAALIANSFLLLPSQTNAQSLSLEDFSALVDQRSATLNGYETYLTDPDPQRAMAALQIMLESGDSTLVQMALSVGIYSADPNVRQTALKAFMAGKPSLDLFFDGATTVAEEEMEAYNALLRGYRGAVGAERRASLSLRPYFTITRSIRTSPWDHALLIVTRMRRAEVASL